MALDHISISNHPILKNLQVSLINGKTGKPYSVVAFVGENGCGKTTLLNEISKTPNSSFIFLRQNSMYVGLANESYKLISGRDELYPDQSTASGAAKIQTNNDAFINLLKELKDNSLIDIFESGKLDHSRCGGEAVRVIDGKTDYFELNTLSSGQQEILIKLKILKNATVKPDFILLDEPETSLHPRWQKQIVNLIKEISNEGNTPQLFVATHSEKVLEALLKDQDALIVSLYKKNDLIECKAINQLNLCLPNPTFSELDYIVFHIPTYEYHDLLLMRFADLCEIEAISDIDKAIKNDAYYDRDYYHKKWTSYTKRGPMNYTTLPVYIRNYFHHPKPGKEPTEEELVKSIKFLQEIIRRILE